MNRLSEESTPDQRLHYGSTPEQFLDVRLPSASGSQAAAVIFIHGGFWRAEYDLHQADTLCSALRRDGLATFNLEYRRVGNPGGGWPGSFDDIRTAFRFIRDQSLRFGIDPSRIVVIGHSAGAQLALVLASREPSLCGVIALGGLLDLGRTVESPTSAEHVIDYLGGTPTDVPERYADADPMRLSISTKQVVVHGLDDEDVPPEMSRSYVATKNKAGEQVVLVEPANIDHFNVIDPLSEAYALILRIVRELTA